MCNTTSVGSINLSMLTAVIEEYINNLSGCQGTASLGRAGLAMPLVVRLYMICLDYSWTALYNLWVCVFYKSAGV